MSEQLLRNLTDSNSQSAAMTWTNSVRPLLDVAPILFCGFIVVGVDDVQGHCYDQQQCGYGQYVFYHCGLQG